VKCEEDDEKREEPGTPKQCAKASPTVDHAALPGDGDDVSRR
jgi:hypothetical protein